MSAKRPKDVVLNIFKHFIFNLIRSIISCNLSNYQCNLYNKYRCLKLEKTFVAYCQTMFKIKLVSITR